MPIDRVITETDGPFTSIDEKSMVPWDAEIAVMNIGKIWKLSPEDAGRKIKNNFINLLEVHARNYDRLNHVSS